ncbi:ABC transporter permease [Anaerocolumna aminovalerica]|uniref:ABC transporter permease n=1 Tax=Anaerocolumna aminovalerica TaxID=1527 RepID=UPI001C0F279E|nr:ABC transporter permease [Anaerocolumna aminovalerica]MBU5334517.1 ABC transporter permease [Anaerocolumna aminovalerica]
MAKFGSSRIRLEESVSEVLRAKNDLQDGSKGNGSPERNGSHSRNGSQGGNGSRGGNSSQDGNSFQNDNISEKELFEFAGYDEASGEKIGYSNYSYWGSTLRAFLKNKMAVTLMVVIFSILLFTIIQPYLPGQFDPNQINNDVKGNLLRNVKPNREHLFGTNSIGQDLWSRVWSGTRTSLLIGVCVAAIEAVVGIIVGVLWGYVRKLDFFFTELYNVLDNIPSTLVLVLFSYIMRPSIASLVIGMSLTRWIGMSRFIRNQIIIIRDRDYNLASRCLGSPTTRIIFKNLLPYLVSVIMLRMAMAIPEAIGSEVFVTYIGLGLPIEIPSLGNLITTGRDLLMNPGLRYQLIFPTIVVSVVTISFYIIGNAFADAADPKNHV